jgi:hypothetical protein
LQRLDYIDAGRRARKTYAQLHERLTEARPLVPDGNFCELRYEELVRDPVGQMEGLYEVLGLGGFAEVRPRIEAYFAARKGYQTNRYTLPAAERAEVERELARVIAETGYQ